MQLVGPQVGSPDIHHRAGCVFDHSAPLRLGRVHLAGRRGDDAPHEADCDASRDERALLAIGDRKAGPGRKRRSGGVAPSRTAGGRIFLVRGVSNNDFSVSLYAHGPIPLVPVTVLGRPGFVYPSADLPASASGMSRVPFADGPDRVGHPCNRWELEATGLADAQLASYAHAIAPIPGDA